MSLEQTPSNQLERWGMNVNVYRPCQRAPNQENRGAHVNVSGAGLVAHARNRTEAILLLEFMAGPEGQRLFAELNHEFPVSVNVQNSGIVSKWGSFKADHLSLGLLGKYNGDAIRLADRPGWR